MWLRTKKLFLVFDLFSSPLYGRSGYPRWTSPPSCVGPVSDGWAAGDPDPRGIGIGKKRGKSGYGYSRGGVPKSPADP